MPTGSHKINVYEKRLLERSAIDENFLTFLVGTIDEVAAAIFQGTSGVLDDDEIEITSSSNDTFTLDVTNASRCIVQSGQIIDLLLRPSSLYTTVAFENATGSTYSVGIKFAEVERGIELNPRTGDPEYPKLIQTYGELAHPDSVSDQTTYIRLVIDSVTDLGDGEDHSGRTVRVWLDDPVSPLESVAYWEGTTSYSASPGNYVDIPYTSPNGPLGQDVGASPPSTTASDYWVFIEGPSIRDKANKDLSTDGDYAFIGEITGNGPAATPVGFDVSGQNPVFINSLDRAYDGATGSGSGRMIYVDSEAVEMRTRGGNTDELGATLRIDRKNDNDDGGSCLQTICDEIGGYEANQVHFIPLTHTAGSMIIDNPASSTNPDLVTRTGSVNWVTSNVNPRSDMVWLQGFSTIDGLYFLYTTPTATQLQLRNLDGSTPTFPGAETGNVTILRAVQITSAQTFGYTLCNLLHGKGGTAFHGANAAAGTPTGDGGDDTACAVLVYADQVDQAHFYEAHTNPLVATWINKAGAIKTIDGVVISPTQDLQSTPNGLELSAAAPNSLTDLPWLASITQSNNLGRIKNPDGDIAAIFETTGRIAEPHIFKDDFHYGDNASAGNPWTSNATAPVQYYARGTGTTAGVCIPVNSGAMGHGGVCQLKLTSSSTGTATMTGAQAWYLDTAKFGLAFFCRIAMNYNASGYNNRKLWIGLVTGTYGVYFEVNNTIHSDTNIWLVAMDGTSANEKKSSTTAMGFDGSNNPQFKNMYFVITGHQTIDYWVEGMGGKDTLTLSTITFNGAGALLWPEVHNEVVTTAEDSYLYLDYWEARDMEALAMEQGNQVY